MGDLSLLAVNQVCLREQWSLQQTIEGCARHGIHGIAVWHDKLAQLGVTEASRMLHDHDMTVTGLCVGGLLGEADTERKWRRCLDYNQRIIDQAAAIAAQCVVFIGGGLAAGSNDIAAARQRCLEGLDRLLPYAKTSGVTIALEPLHPMVCALRSCLITLKQANDWCDELGAGAELGIAVDTYNVWWDPDLERQIERAGQRIKAFHVSDWLADTQDLRLDRGMIGDGVIDIVAIRKKVEAAGYRGMREIEILSARDWWRRDPDEVIRTIKERYPHYV